MPVPALLLTTLALALAAELLETTKAQASVGVRGTTCGQSSNSTTLTLAKPAGTVSGTCSWQASALPRAPASATPSGWTQVTGLRGTVNAEQELVTWYRVAGGAEPASYTFTAGGGTDAISGGIAAYTGVDTLGADRRHASTDDPVGITISDTLPNSNGAAAGSLRVSAVAADDGTNTSYQSR